METAPADCLTIEAGAGARLSPDGTRVAFADFEGLVVADLLTGARTRLSRDQYRVVAWSPDGRSVLIVNGTGTFLVDVDSHASRPLGPPLAFGRADIQVAFSPDGLWVAMGGAQTMVTTLGGSTLWTADLGRDEFLAGPGGFTPDGTRIVTVTVHGCAGACGTEDIATRQWTFGYREAGTGAKATGPVLPALTAASVRALGWTSAGDLIAVRTDAARDEPADRWQSTIFDPREHGHATVVALHPGGAVTTVLDTADGVTGLDLAQDLVIAGRFGGPSAAPSFFAADPMWFGVYIGPWMLVAVGVTALIAWRVRRRHRSSVRPAT